MISARVIFLPIFLIFPIPLAVYADAGNLDPTFGINGKITYDLTGSGVDEDYGQAVALQSDGKIVVAGSSSNSTFDFSMFRLHENGVLDTTFGTGGVVFTDFDNNNDSVIDILIQPDGKIVAAGFTVPTPGVFCPGDITCDYAIARYNSNGTIDTSFGSQGKIKTDFAGSSDSAYGIALQSDGKIVISGVSFTNNAWDFSLVRYDANGILDSTFGTGGKVVTDFVNGSNDFGWGGVAIESNGKIVVGGSVVTTNFYDFAVARYNSDGSLDNSFNSTGKIIKDLFTKSDHVLAVAIQPDDKIVLAGNTTIGAGATPDFALARLNSDGSLDLSFSSDGVQVTDIAGADDSISSIELQPDGKIVSVGQSLTTNSNDFSLTRYTTDGELDLKYGTSGKTITDFDEATDAALATALQTDGKIIAVGYAAIDANNNFAIARYQTDSLPPCIFCDDFEDGQLATDWTYIKPQWNETGGNLVGTPIGRKAEATANPAFGGCTQCTFQATMSTQGGDGNRLWLFAWHIDKTYTVELLMKEENDKWVLKQRIEGSVVTKTKALATIIPDVFYNVQVSFDGSVFILIVDGVTLATMPAFSAPIGTAGFRVKNTTGSFGSLTVN